MHFSLSSRNYRFFARAAGKIWVTRANVLASRENLFPGMFVGGDRDLRVHERAREKSIPKVKRGCTFEHSSDFMSNGTRECLQPRMCLYIYVCMCVCARVFWIARLLAGLQRTLLYVLLLLHGDSIIIYFVCRTRVLS